MSRRVLAITMGDRLSFGQILRLAMGGAIGGLVTFVMLNQTLRGQVLFGNGDSSRGIWLSEGTRLGAVIGFTIGACLIAAAEWQTRSAKRILHRTILGGLAGLLCGGLGGLDGQFMFSVFQPVNLLVARCVGWALMGAGAGICPGLVVYSYKRAQLGAAGGLLGGAVGGVIFDALIWIFRNEDLSRVVGLVLVGAAIGIAVGLLEEIAKEYWLTFLSGSKEGRTYMLSKDDTTIGRDETVDIPLFGDSTVQKIHARITKTNGDMAIMSTQGGHPVFVNSQPVVSSALSDGDIITIGNHRMRFGSRHSGQSVQASMPQQQVATVQTPSLQVISGPHAGKVYALSQASVSIGRSPECTVALTGDTSVSRQHAVLLWDGALWRVQDCGSTNGVFVNGQRISTHVLQADDVIRMGDSTLRIS